MRKSIYIAIFLVVAMTSGCSTITQDYVVQYINTVIEEQPNLSEKIVEGLQSNKIVAVKNMNGDYILRSRHKEYESALRDYHVKLLNDFFERDKTPPELREVIKGRKIRIGMSQPQVVTSWGDPEDINYTINAYGKHEQWIYGKRYSSQQYIYFDDKVLTAIQN